MSATTDAVIAQAILDNFPNNTARFITPAKLREVMNELNDSKISRKGDSLIEAALEYTSVISITDAAQLVHKQYVDDEIAAVAETIDLTDYVKKDGTVSMTGTLITPGVDVAATGGSDTLSIGVTNADIINIGHSGAVINIQGATYYQNVTELQVTDKLITLNKGGSAGSASGSGIEFEEGGSATGYWKTNAARTGFEMKAPSTAGILTFIPGSSAVSLTAGNTGTIATLAGTEALCNKDLTASTNTYRNASATVIGAVNLSAQTFTGQKTFTSEIIVDLPSVTSGGLRLGTTGAATNAIDFYGSGSRIALFAVDANAAYFATYGTRDFLIYTGGASFNQRFIVKSAGQVGIGLNLTPAAMLDVKALASTVGFKLGQTSGVADLVALYDQAGTPVKITYFDYQGKLVITDTTTATSATAGGSLRNGGGFANGGNAFIGGRLKVGTSTSNNFNDLELNKDGAAMIATIINNNAAAFSQFSITAGNGSGSDSGTGIYMRYIGSSGSPNTPMQANSSSVLMSVSSPLHVGALTAHDVKFFTNNVERFSIGGSSGDVTYISKVIFAGTSQSYGSANNTATDHKILYRNTTDDTITELTTDGAAGSGTSNRILVPNHTSMAVIVSISCKQSGSSNSRQFLRQVVITNNGGATAIEGSVAVLGTDGGSAGLSAATVTITADDTNDSLKVQVTGIAATNLKWTAKVISTETLYS